MKTEKNILVAFVLNLIFSILEFIGGILTGSVAIISDSVHDMGDAASIGLSFFLEKKSKKKPDNRYTYGYIRYSVLGAFITNVILLTGSIFVIYNAILRIINPVEINYDGMIIFAIIGTLVNFAAAYFTKEGDSLNQKAVNLHMLEDVLGWIVVLIGAIIMRFTDIPLIDAIMCIGVACYIFINAFKGILSVFNIFLVKVPESINVDHLKEHLCEISGVLDIHHLHIWSMDGYKNFATMHVVTNTDAAEIKKSIKEELSEHGIIHSVIEFEFPGEKCLDSECNAYMYMREGSHHHHHSHFHHH